jgi:Dyp-type peroxidase family
MRYGQGHGHGGFLDGVSNLQELPPKYFDACVFVGAEDAPFAGGSYAVIRKYEENLEMWTDLPDVVQEQIIGRRKTDGRLIGGDLLWRRNGGEKVLATAHVACARPDRHNEGFSWQDRLYRRSINYMEAPDRGTISYGLVFLTLNRDPAIQTERIHNTYMFPQNGDGDLLMTAGYVRALRTFLVYLPPRRTLDT